ncbi:MAG: flavin-dependent oxidoreductase [Alphaproteobacteria bacterium]
MRELTELGLAERLAETAIETKELIYANRHGQEIWREPRGREAGYRWPQYSIHRGRLQMILFETARARLGADRVRTGQRLVGLDRKVSGVVAVFAARDGSERRVAADVLVGADGIHSAVRGFLHPGEGPPKWNGRILWRAVTEAEPFLSGRSMVMAGHQNQKFVCYPICRATAARGRSLVNWIAELSVPDRVLADREDWNRRGDLCDFLPRFENWDFGWLQAPDLIRGADAVYEFPMVDRDPLERWTEGRATLLGDAAHPMYPIGSNGASQAILDARTLAWHLAMARDPDAGLAAYEADRRPATARIVLANRANGPEQSMQLVEERAPAGFADIRDVVSREELEAIAAGYKRLAGFDVAALNERASLDVPAT